MHRTGPLFCGGLIAKTGSPLLAGKTSLVPGGWRDFLTLLEQIEDDDILFKIFRDNDKPKKPVDGSLKSKKDGVSPLAGSNQKKPVSTDVSSV